MSVNKFTKIWRYINFINNDENFASDYSSHDRLHKIRPIIDHLKKIFNSAALEANVSIDEQMC